MALTKTFFTSPGSSLNQLLDLRGIRFNVSPEHTELALLVIELHNGAVYKFNYIYTYIGSELFIALHIIVILLYVFRP